MAKSRSGSMLLIATEQARAVWRLLTLACPAVVEICGVRRMRVTTRISFQLRKRRRSVLLPNGTSAHRKNKMDILTQATIRRLLCYNPFTGNFMWRVSNSNRVRVGMYAGSTQHVGPDRRPYRFISVYGKRYPAHRLAFLYMIGHFPFGEVDHYDRNGLNNCWTNLRDSTHSQNLANRGLNKNNSTGVKGVYIVGNGRYRARIMVRGNYINLGRYDKLEDAAKAYIKAAKKYFGKFARAI